MSVTRELAAGDERVLAELALANQAFLAPWQPLRPKRYYTLVGQREAVDQLLAQRVAGTAVPLVIEDDASDLVGMITLQSIIRGAFQSCSVGYWLAETAQGQGLATRALHEAVVLAFDELRLHRVQAETLPSNLASQRVLQRVGFVQYGSAPSYLQIAGRWRDNLLYQLLTPTPEKVVTG